MRVEAPVDEGLDTAAEWREERGDGKGGGDNGKLGPVPSTGLEHLLQADDTANVHQRKAVASVP